MRCLLLLVCALLGCNSSYEDRLQEALAVTAQEIRDLAERIFDSERALLTLVGPVTPEHTAALEVLLARPADSTVWLHHDEEEEPSRERAPASTPSPVLVAS